MVASFVLITIRNELGVIMVLESLEQTFRSVGTILWVTFGATVLAGAFSLSGGNKYVADAILGLDVAPIGVILVMMLIFLILGMFMDWIGIVLLTMPVFMPIVKQLGYDPIWFGILFSVNMQVAFLTPPFGSAAFYLKSVTPPEIDLVTIYRSFGPFMCLQLGVLALLLFFRRSRCSCCGSRSERSPSETWRAVPEPIQEVRLAVAGHRRGDQGVVVAFGRQTGGESIRDLDASRQQHPAHHPVPGLRSSFRLPFRSSFRPPPHAPPLVPLAPLRTQQRIVVGLVPSRAPNAIPTRSSTTHVPSERSRSFSAA